MKTVYIAGKITGLPDYQQKFRAAEIKLNEKGYKKVINPCCLPVNLDYEQYMPICFAMIDVADAVFFLDNWEDSDGAKREMSYALAKKKEIMYEDN